MQVPIEASAVITLAYRGITFWMPVFVGMLAFRSLHATDRRPLQVHYEPDLLPPRGLPVNLAGLPRMTALPAPCGAFHDCHESWYAFCIVFACSGMGFMLFFWEGSELRGDTYG